MRKRFLTTTGFRGRAAALRGVCDRRLHWSRSHETRMHRSVPDRLDRLLGRVARRAVAGRRDRCHVHHRGCGLGGAGATDNPSHDRLDLQFED